MKFYLYIYINITYTGSPLFPEDPGQGAQQRGVLGQLFQVVRVPKIKSNADAWLEKYHVQRHYFITPHDLIILGH